MKKVSLIFATIMMVLIVSCSNKKIFNIDSNIPLKYNITQGSKVSGSVFLQTVAKYGGLTRRKFTGYKLFMTDTLNTLEVEYWLWCGQIEDSIIRKVISSKYDEPVKFFIGSRRNEKDENTAYYVIWHDDKKYYKLIPDIWEINNNTDMIISNLPEKTIKELYPNFSGKFVRRTPKQIEILTEDSPESYDFYKKIKFSW